MQKRVKVWGNDVMVEVYQQSKSVWTASGEYLGRRYDTKGRSATQAASAWAEAARYHSG